MIDSDGSIKKQIGGASYRIFQSNNRRQLMESFRIIAGSLGYRSNIMTLQEHNMIGSSGTNNSEDIDPYTPIGLVEDGLTLGEVKTARDLEKHFLSYSIGFIFNEGDSQQDVIPVSLEPLGNDGKTIRDPQPLDKDLRVISNYSVEFIPYQREL